MRQRNLPVEPFRESFEIDIGRVDVIVNTVESLIRDLLATSKPSPFSGPYSFAALQISITYSPQMVGSL